uniref:Uncharacterized protein n=1 Tax=Tanacetum cinerariifolium TaxID=118510 RepID=A0A699HXY9_TANCI|nr:hypothetical protein [Tanacetum cinerariifolium]
MTTPKAHRTPILTAASPQGKKRKQSVRETSSPRKSFQVTIKQKPKTTSNPPPSDDRERDETAEATLLSLALHKTTIQENLAEEEIEKMVEGEEDDELYASVFADSMLNDDVDDSGTRIRKCHKKDDDNDEIEKDKKDDDNENVEKIYEVVKEKENDDQTGYTLVGSHVTGSMEFKKKRMQTPIPSPNRSPRKDLSYNKTISWELMATVSPTAATKSKDSSKSKSKKGFTFNKTKIHPGSIDGMCKRHGQIRNHIKNKFVPHEFFMGKIREVLDHCNKVVPEMTFSKTNEIIKKGISHLVNLAVNKDREIIHTNTP